MVARLDVGRAVPRSSTAARTGLPTCTALRARRHRRRPDAAGDHVDLRREAAVDPAEHAVLLVDQRRHLQQPRRRASPAAPDSRRSPRRRPAGRGACRRQLAAAPAAMAKGAVARCEQAALREGRGRRRPPLDLRRESRRRSGRRAASVASRTRQPRASISSASACAGNMCPPVPPAAMTRSGASRSARRAPRMSSISCCGRLRVIASSTPRPEPRGDQRRAAVGDQRQRHALGRQQPHRDADVDHRLHAEQHREPGAGEPDERVALAHEPQQRADHDGEVERHDDDAEDQPELLGGDRDDEVGVRVRQRPLDAAVADADPEEAALLDGVRRVADLGQRIDLRGRGSRRCAARRARSSGRRTSRRRSPRRRRRRAAPPARRRRSTSAPRWR